MNLNKGVKIFEQMSPSPWQSPSTKMSGFLGIIDVNGIFDSDSDLFGGIRHAGVFLSAQLIDGSILSAYDSFSCFDKLQSTNAMGQGKSYMQLLWLVKVDLFKGKAEYDYKKKVQFVQQIHLKGRNRQEQVCEKR